jgi:hypothetical protein
MTLQFPVSPVAGGRSAWFPLCCISPLLAVFPFLRLDRCRADDCSLRTARDRSCRIWVTLRPEDANLISFWANLVRAWSISRLESTPSASSSDNTSSIVCSKVERASEVNADLVVLMHFPFARRGKQRHLDGVRSAARACVAVTLSTMKSAVRSSRSGSIEMRLFAVSVAPIWSHADRATFSIAIAVQRRFQRRPVEPKIVMSHARRGKTCFEPLPHGFAIES